MFQIENIVPSLIKWLTRNWQTINLLRAFSSHKNTILYEKNQTEELPPSLYISQPTGCDDQIKLVQGFQQKYAFFLLNKRRLWRTLLGVYTSSNLTDDVDGPVDWYKRIHWVQSMCYATSGYAMFWAERFWMRKTQYGNIHWRKRKEIIDTVYNLVWFYRQAQSLWHRW